MSRGAQATSRIEADLTDRHCDKESVLYTGEQRFTMQRPRLVQQLMIELPRKVMIIIIKQNPSQSATTDVRCLSRVGRGFHVISVLLHSPLKLSAHCTLATDIHDLAK